MKKQREAEEQMRKNKEELQVEKQAVEQQIVKQEESLINESQPGQFVMQTLIKQVHDKIVSNNFSDDELNIIVRKSEGEVGRHSSEISLEYLMKVSNEIKENGSVT